MLRYLPVRRVHARQVLDSRGNPTVEVEVTVGEGVIGINGYTGRAIVPSGASTGKFEAVELRDGEKGCYTGLGVRKAVENVNTKLAEAILGENALDQSYIDKKIIETDGTDNKSNVQASVWYGSRQDTDIKERGELLLPPLLLPGILPVPHLPLHYFYCLCR